jgi:hypothetical protein
MFLDDLILNSETDRCKSEFFIDSIQFSFGSIGKNVV